jgi:hypothetical protein
MNILFRACFRQKISRRNLAENLIWVGSGRLKKSDPDPIPVENRPDPQHCEGLQ